MAKQKTIASPVSIEGIGLQTGLRVKINLKSSSADSGIRFIRMDLDRQPVIDTRSISVESHEANKRRTTVKKGSAEVQTTEHLLAAIYGLGLNNISIEVYGEELPGLDGSSKEYVEAIEKAGIAEQETPAGELAVKDEICCSDNGAFLAAFPYNGFKISYFLSYPVKSIKDQFLSLELSPDNFKNEIAPARTFCMKKEALLLKALGLGKGADYKNTLIMGKRGPYKNILRFSDEPVRHKILDLIGDLSLAGAPLKAHIVAVKSGHRLNMEMVKKLKCQNTNTAK